MKLHRLGLVVVGWLGLSLGLPALLWGDADGAGDRQSSPPVDQDIATAQPPLPAGVVAFLNAHCVRCHGPEVQKARFTVHEIAADDLERWEKIAEMVSLEDMPPPDEPQPTDEEREAFVGWVDGHLASAGLGASDARMALPSYANRLDHDALFSGEHTGPAFSYARLWRMSQPIYDELARRSASPTSRPASPTGRSTR